MSLSGSGWHVPNENLNNGNKKNLKRMLLPDAGPGDFIIDRVSQSPIPVALFANTANHKQRACRQ